MRIPAVLQENAYNIVGLPTGTPLQAVKKRTSHLISLAKIDESEVFASDLGDVSILRTEMGLKRALEKLTSVKDRLDECFFWFEFLTVLDEETYKDVIVGNFQGAIEKWTTLDSKTSWLSKKNLGLVLFLEAFANKSFLAYQKCIETWLEISKSDNFWQFYGEFYKSNDDLGTDISLLAEFRKNFPQRISRYANEMYHQLQDPKVIGHFFKAFKIIGPELEQNILSPAIRQVYEISSKISNETYLGTCINNSADLDNRLSDLLNGITTLNAFGLDGYAPVEIAKEKCAEQLRTAAIYINNKYSNPTLSLKVLESASQISKMESQNIKIRRDQDVVTENIQRNDQWASEISYQVEIGLIFKDKLCISPDGIEWKGKHFPLNSITWVKWGAVNNSVNGIPTGTDYDIGFGDEQSSAEIKTRKEDIFRTFTDKLWRAVCVRLLTETLETLRSGKTISIGNTVIDDNGLQLQRHKFFGTESEYRKWGQVSYLSARGSLLIIAQDDKKIYAELPYLTTPNAHILEAIIRLSFKKWTGRLSGLLND